MSVRVEHADMLPAIPCLVAEGVVCDAIVTDPPYHLVQISERSKYPVKYGKDGAMQRLLSGFMDQTWDGGDIAFRPETWATVATVLRPGAFLVAFGGTRTYHRLACAIEDGGFVIQDCLMWLFATGFPKRRDNLKPAYEPVVLAYKPGGKRTMQVDECRIATVNQINPCGSFQSPSDMAQGWSRPWMADRDDLRARKEAAIDRANNLGRWPANVVHDGSDEVLAAFPQSAAGQPSEIRGKGGIWAPSADGVPCGPQYGDSGSAARFFFSAKAGAQDRWGSLHPTVKPIELMKWLIALVCPPGGLVLDPFAGSGTTGVAALATGRNAILIEREAAYVADIREHLAHHEGGGGHSTQAKHRNRAVDHGPLFAAAPLTREEDAIDSLLSYNGAVMAIGERVKAGEPVPEFMLSQKAQP